MIKKNFFISFVMSIFLCVALAWAGPQMNPGKWEVTTQTEMAGMPPQSITHTQCITDEDLVPISQDASQECHVSDMTTKGNTVSWKISCGDHPNRMEGTGKITYHGDSMEGTMHMVMSGANLEFTNHITGRRIGKCDGQEASSPKRSTEKTQEKPSNVEKAVAEDVKDVGQAARDETKQSTIDEVRKGVRGLFNKWFD